MIVSQTFATTEGDTQIYYPALVSVNPLCVCRNGTEHDQVTGTPVGLQFKYLGRGFIYFDTSVPFEANEKIFVLYEY